MDNPRIVSGPSGTPYDLAALKRHCRAIDSDQDAWLGDVAPTAVQILEEYLGRSLLVKAYAWTLDVFVPSRALDSDFYFCETPSGLRYSGTINIPMMPLVAITSIAYVDAAGATQTLPADQYQVDTIHARIRPSKAAGNWPQTDCVMNAVTINFTAGYATIDAIPTRLKTALYTLIGHWFEHRDATTAFTLENTPLGFFDLIEDYRGMGF